MALARDRDAGTGGRPGAGGSRFSGLSGRLLILTIVVVMLSEVLIFVPSIANFHRAAIEDRIANGTVAARALASAAAGELPEDMQAALLDEMEAYALAVRAGGMKRLLAIRPSPPPVEREIDIAALTPVSAILEAVDTLFAGSSRVIRATGPYRGEGVIEVVFNERPLRAAMAAYARNILILSLVISMVTAAAVYIALQRLIVRPMARLGAAVALWADNPADPQRRIVPSGRSDEIGRAEAGLAAMQEKVAGLFVEQRRLADLGLAVSKINHDLRNLLASAQLVSDRLAAIPDPTVQRFAPKLISALDRAIAYAGTVLSYGKAQEAPPARRLVRLSRIVEEVAEAIGLRGHATIACVNAVPEALEVDADPEQLFRVLMNLMRNALQAMEPAADGACVCRLTVSAARGAGGVTITVADTGPGLPEKAREALFRPFQGSARRGGTGLGLAIAAELIRAHGGSIRLADDGPGATFVIDIPDRATAVTG